MPSWIWSTLGCLTIVLLFLIGLGAVLLLWLIIVPRSFRGDCRYTDWIPPILGLGAAGLIGMIMSNPQWFWGK